MGYAQLGTRTALTLSLVACGWSVNAATMDLRECPLDRLTFIDPWAGGSFKVERVGGDYSYLCGVSGLVDEAVDGERCKQLGSTVLDGTLQEHAAHPATTFHIWVIWEVVDGSPCCNWSVAWPEPARQVSHEWLTGRDVPLLGDMPFATIERSDDWERSMTLMT
ncbi:MAG: hypothetical protein ABIO40_03315 [Devosia sp.]